jgi:glycosyltransferase involved in cell wall biosynthesis
LKKISVITPSLNSEKFIQRAIDSVVQQDYTNIEHVVIDGASSDQTVNILKSNPHVKWVSEPDTGQSNAMNKGFVLSSGEIIVYLNADDYFYPDTFTPVVEAFDEGVDIVFGNIDVITPNRTQKKFIPSIDYADIIRHWKRLFPINPIQYFYRREFQETIGFNEQNHYTMDHEFLLSLCAHRRIVALEKTFGVFDMHNASKTVQGMRSPDIYWNSETFAYVNNFLTDFDKEFIINFKEEQHAYFTSVIKEYYSAEILSGAARIHKFIEANPSIIVYGGGTLTEKLWPLIRENVAFVVDKNPEQCVASFKKQVRFPEALNKESSPTVLVTPFKYRKEIQQTISSINSSAQVHFLQDLVDNPTQNDKSSIMV